ncbi:Organic hydroperoxide resistance transcriptional regulator [Pseudovibrio sp. Ad13]|uniref:MarR family winged helix-turn-helix transcriptional regulator n=1 Tax=unclassified Pseudovibrio TaxID=2627060 RepID=UPI00070CA450|nr:MULTISPECIES: MarR family transcriptional regulator [unclassified Pseudovibrio]KZK83138.1 Organic hydroperoxide resistance transcriptional regulator [Pseudovibrio sp. Ad13]KZK98449.1 Organic hydroperoxide resistance transcriptional regulator [Pseudovibrio sp. W74]KZL08295.1 Organic hydroperoxide resistance transcriptional regulator [Pseudovibrio sp. Ad14]
MTQFDFAPESQKATIQTAHLLLQQAARLRQKLQTAVTEACDLTLSEKELLGRVQQSGGEVRMSDISSALMFTEGGATKIIGRLEKQGLVTRHRSQEDKRVILINITEEGESKLATALSAMANVAYPLLSKVYSEEECAQMSRLLEKLGAHPDLL